MAMWTAVGIGVLAIIVFAAGLFWWHGQSTHPALNTGVSATAKSTTNVKSSGSSSSTSSPVASTEIMKKYTVKNATTREAVCNDGSPATFYYRKGTGSGTDKWVVFMEGGGFCLSEQDCAARWKTQHGLMTSSGDPDEVRKDGLLSGDPSQNPDFYNWNQVMLMYCSSDRWSGDSQQALTMDGKPIVFKGSKIVQAVFEDLQDAQVVPTSITNASSILVAGSSAGAKGAANNIDRVASWFPKIDVRGLIDCGYDLDYPAYAPISTVDYAHLYPMNMQMDASCAAAHTDDTGACFTHSVLYPYLSTPVFTYLDLTDPSRIQEFGVNNLKDPDQLAFTKGYAQALDANLQAFPDALFAPADGIHTILASGRFTTAEIDGTSLAQAFGNWYFHRSGPTKLIAPLPPRFAP